MKTLRAKIVVLLVTAIISVVVGVTTVMAFLLGPPDRTLLIDPVAQQVQMVTQTAAKCAGNPFISPSPAVGQVDESVTQWLREALVAQGSDLAVTVSRVVPDAAMVVSVPIEGRGWWSFPISDLPPSNPWPVLSGWLAMISTGVTAIALFAANRAVQPLMLLEAAVAAVGPDAMMPHLPERGPAEVRATAKALNSLSSRLKRAVESRMRLVAAAGHDLRTPMTRMRLRAEFVESEEERSLWLRDLDELERIADSAILLVREETGSMPPELLRLDATVSSVAHELQVQDYAISLGRVEPVTVRAGRLALNRALRNVMINAATHGKSARVTVESTPVGKARVTVLDEGPGIPQDLLEQVFEPFFRADPARRQNVPGAGLGLSIAREILRRAGGDIRISNRPEGGLAQVIELPIHLQSADTVSGQRALA